jgi:hypothetical protein
MVAPLDLAPFAWLIPLAFYDLKTRRVPSGWFAAAPCLISSLIALLRGEWAMVVAAAAIYAVSERASLPDRWMRYAAFTAGVSVCAWMMMIDPLSSPGIISMLGFWFMFELNWWGGVDALLAMGLMLLWNDPRFVVCWLAAQILVQLARGRYFLLAFPRPLKSEELDALGFPALPALTIAALLFVAWKWFLQ